MKPLFRCLAIAPLSFFSPSSRSWTKGAALAVPSRTHYLGLAADSLDRPGAGVSDQPAGQSSRAVGKGTERPKDDLSEAGQGAVLLLHPGHLEVRP